MGEFFNSPYSLNAPTYVDFNQATPNASRMEEFFEVIHPEHEHGDHLGLQKEKKEEEEELASPLETVPANGSFIECLDAVNMTPIRIVSPKSKKNKDQVILGETTAENVIKDVNNILASTSMKKSTRNLRISKSLYDTKFAKIAGGGKDENEEPIKSKETNRKTLGAKIQVNLTAHDELDIADVKLLEKNTDGKPVKITRVTRSMTANKSLNKNKIPPTEVAAAAAELKEIDQLTDKVSNVSLDTTTIPQQEQELVINDCHDNATVNVPVLKNVEEKKLGMNESGDSIVKILTAAKNIKKSYVVSTSSSSTTTNLVPGLDNLDQNVAEDFHDDVVNDVDKYKVHHTNLIEKPPITKTRGKQPTVLTSQARRRSSIMHNGPRASKYISIAEAVTKFQRATPDRFHTTKAVPKQLQRLAKYEPKRTVPVSPALQSKTRIRRNHVLSQAEREELELQEMKKHQVHAKPVRLSILAAAKPLKEVAKKPVTVPKPFHLTRVAPKSSSSAGAAAGASDKSSSTTSSTVDINVQATKKSTAVRKNNLVPRVDATNNKLTVAEEKILHFGIPTHTKVKTVGSIIRMETKKKNIQPLSSAFDARNKQFLDKKEEKIKKLQSQEAEKIKAEFHARPVPSNIKKGLKKNCEIAANNKSTDTHHHTKPAPFSFQERDKSLVNKKEELKKKLEEEEKKKRIFHANPVPNFKPVTVRARSKENLNKDEKNPANVLGAKSKSSSSIVINKPKARLHNASSDNLKIASLKTLDQENRAPNQRASSSRSIMPVLKQKLQPFDLHSDKRAKLRKDYDESIRQKIEMDEIKRKREIADKLAREQAEINEMRKKAEIKARPMPAFKPPVVVKSNKPLTAPESPAWAKRFQK